MTQFSLTLPLDRVSPVRVPTRDLVLGGTDSVTLNVSIVDRDSPDALPVELSGGIGGPAVSMFVWPDHRGGYGPHFGGWGSGDDYGWGSWYGGGVAGPGTVLWSATGVILDTTTGTFAIVVPPGTMGCWPRRCRWAIYFDADAGGSAIAGGPNGLVSALRKIEVASKQIPLDANPATAHMFIIKPFSASNLLGLFSTHPPTADRIQALLQQR